MSLRSDLIAALEFGPDEVRPLANRLAIRKIAVYRATLQRLADAHDLPKPVLSSRILSELYIEATNDAENIIGGHNDRLPKLVDSALEYADGDTQTALVVIEELLHDRAEKQAPVVAVTGLYSSHADATLAFHLNAGLRPLYDFGGHGDADPACALCVAIRDRNPHPADRVIAIGAPHHRCAQQWHPVGPVDMPTDYVPGNGGTIGIVGERTLERRHGSLKAAIAALDRME